MRDGGGVNFYGFSSRHIRLKYQAVSAAAVAALISSASVESISIPGLVKFSDTPPTWVLNSGIILFALFSFVAFHFQTRIERKHIPLTGMLFSNEIKRQSHDLVEKVRSLTGESFDIYRSAIVNELDSLPPESLQDESSLGRWGPIARHFYKVQTASEFALIQLSGHREAVAKEIYQGSSSFDAHYSNAVQMLAMKVKTLIDNLWRPNNLRPSIGNIQYASDVIEDLKHLNLIAESLIYQHEALFSDLKEYNNLKKINQEALSVQIPYCICCGLLVFAILYPTLNLLSQYV